jgi:hypothetical protein
MYPAEVEFLTKLPAAASRSESLFQKPSWGWGAQNNAVIFKEPNWFGAITFSQTIVQTSSYEKWTEKAEFTRRFVTGAIDAMQPRKLERATFRIRAHFDLGLTHVELCNAIFGSVLPAREQLQDAFPGLDDLFVQFNGIRNGFKYELGLNPQTPEQIRITIPGWPNVENFQIEETRRNPVLEFLTGIESPTLSVFSEVKLENEPTTGLADFMRRCESEMDELVTAAVNKVRGMPTID